ncbi:MAG: hypothetical protein EBR09_14770 [Proteobacteria bacterium]|nr:hypothetical protein [Pseudomonadota bacterium]
MTQNAVRILWGVLAWSAAVSIAGFAGADRWDGHEYYVPVMTWFLRDFFSGHFPFINPHQHLGEPIEYNLQASLLYPPLWLAGALQEFFSSSPRHLLQILFQIHIAIFSPFLYFLLKRLEFRAEVALFAAGGILFSGFSVLYSVIWHFIPPSLGWPVVILFGILDIREGFYRRGTLLIACATAMLGLLGHPQMLLYSVLFSAPFFALLYNPDNLRPLFSAAGHALAGLFISMPALLPQVFYSHETARRGAVTYGEFVKPAVVPQLLSGLFSPVIDVKKGFITPDGLASFTGMLVPIGLVFFIISRKAVREFLHERTLSAQFSKTALLTGLTFVILSLGKYGLILGLTHPIPVWSSFRWPFKFFGYGLLGLSLGLGTIYVQTAGRLQNKQKKNLAFCILIILLLQAYYNSKPSSVVIAVISSSAASAAFLMFYELKLLRMIALPLAVVNTGLIFFLAESAPTKLYKNDLLPKKGQSLPADGRVLSAIPFNPDDFHWARGYTQAASVFGYYSVSGCSNSFVSKKYQNEVGSDIFGVISREKIKTVLENKRDILSRWNVKYATVAIQDEEIKTALKRSGFEKSVAFPPVFTSDVEVWERKGYIAPAAVLVSAGTRTPLFLSNDKPQRPDHFTVNLPENAGGVLQAPLIRLDGWSVRADGREIVTDQSENLLTAAVPQGTRSITLSYTPRGWILSCVLSVAAMISLLVAISHRRFRKFSAQSVSDNRVNSAVQGL